MLKYKQIFPFIIIAIISIVYWTSLSNGFVWLDQAEILNGKLIITDFSAFIQMLIFDDNNYAGYHRPMYNLMHSLDHLLWDKNAMGYHLSSLVLHIAIALLLFRILANITGNRYFAFTAALVFGLLPCHTATVSLIHSKADLLATFFILLTISLISKIDSKNNQHVSGIRIFLFSLFFLLAILSKEVAIILPFYMLVIAFLFYVNKIEIPKPAFLYPIFILVVLYLGFRMSSTHGLSNPDALGFVDRILSFIPVYVDYILLTLSGIELTTNDAVMIWDHIGVGNYIFYVILFIAILWLQYFLSKKHLLIAAGFLWYNIFLIPVSQLIPILHFRADRFMYIPSIGFVIAIVYLLFHNYEKHGWAKYKTPLVSIFGIYLLTSSFNIWQRNKDFYSNDTLFGELIKSHPECREAQGFMANEYIKSRNYDQALIHMNQALNVQNEYYSFVDEKSNYGNLGLIYMNQNKIPKALEIFQKIKSQERFNPVVLFNIGICHKRLKNYSAAKSHFEQYLAYKPDNVDALFNLGQVGMELSDPVMVKKYFSRYLQLNPGSTHRNLIEDVLKSIDG